MHHLYLNLKKDVSYQDGFPRIITLNLAQLTKTENAQICDNNMLLLFNKSVS